MVCTSIYWKSDFIYLYCCFPCSPWCSHTWKGWVGVWSSCRRLGMSWCRCRRLWRKQDWSPIIVQMGWRLWRSWEKSQSITDSSSLRSATCPDFTQVTCVKSEVYHAFSFLCKHMIILLNLLYTYMHNFEDSQKLNGTKIHLYICRIYRIKSAFLFK